MILLIKNQTTNKIIIFQVKPIVTVMKIPCFRVDLKKMKTLIFLVTFGPNKKKTWNKKKINSMIKITFTLIKPLKTPLAMKTTKSTIIYNNKSFKMTMRIQKLISTLTYLMIIRYPILNTTQSDVFIFFPFYTKFISCYD